MTQKRLSPLFPLQQSCVLRGLVLPFFAPENNGWSLFYLETLDLEDKQKWERHGNEIVELVWGMFVDFPSDLLPAPLHSRARSITEANGRSV